MFLQKSLQSAFQFGLLPSKPCLFPLKSSLEFILHRGKIKFIGLPVKFPADRSKFQFCTAAWSIVIFTRTVLPCLCFYFSKSNVRINAKYAFQYTFKSNITQYAKKKKKRKNNVEGLFWRGLAEAFQQNQYNFFDSELLFTCCLWVTILSLFSLFPLLYQPNNQLLKMYFVKVILTVDFSLKNQTETPPVTWMAKMD